MMLSVTIKANHTEHTVYSTQQDSNQIIHYSEKVIIKINLML
jgi:hypothetical protein